MNGITSISGMDVLRAMSGPEDENPYDDDFGPGDGSGDGEHGTQEESGVLLKTRPKTKKPSMYKVLLLNDDYTPMEFVTHVLEKFFNKTRQEATEVMLHVHRRGVGVAGIFTYEVAETKVARVMDFARQNEQPLQCTMEKE
ncbi:MAG TPA: ATP-dependent Clp protease adapter ClpS [Alphaproteobacteria bacterium]|nr:ATP-dependent Clp protease adapter ClpS [Alphaproteobacteria bacterium]